MAKLFGSTTLMAIIACLLWSSAFAGIKIGLQYTTPLHFAGVRFMIAGLLVLLFCGNLQMVFTHVRGSLRLMLFVAFFQTTLLYSLFYLGLDLLPGAIAAIVIGTQPLVIAIVAHFVSRAEQMTVRKILSIALGITGVTIIASTRGELTIEGRQELFGIGLLMLSNISSAVANLMVAKRTATIPPLVLNSFQLFFGGGFLLILSFFTEERVVVHYPFQYYCALGWLSFLSAAAFSIWFMLLKRDGVLVSELNVWKFLIPLSGACLSWMLLDNESPDLGTLAGMFSIALALLVLNIDFTRFSGEGGSPKCPPV